MSIRDMEGGVSFDIPVNTVLVSVSDKTGLENIIPAILEMNKDARILSTGGTFKRLQGFGLGQNLMEVGDYTGFPEMDGGLVKTLNPKIFAGILGERNNPKHQQYLRELGDGAFIDMVIVNLYPFQDVLKKYWKKETDPNTQKPYSYESVRGNIDIGGPSMLRAAGKNFLSCAGVCDPKDYEVIVRQIRQQDSCTTLEQRYDLVQKIFRTTKEYDAAIEIFLSLHKADEVAELYRQMR